MAGPALAGVLLALGSPGTALAVDAATFAVSAACLLGVRAPRLRRRGRDRAPSSPELRHGWREFSSRSWMVAVVVSAAITNAIFFPIFQVLGPTVADDSLGGSSAWALIAALFGVGGLLGGGLAPRHPAAPPAAGQRGLHRPLRDCRSLLLAIPASTAVIAAGALVAGAAVGLAEVLYETTAAQHIPPESLSRVVAYDWFGSLALEPLGLALVGPLAAGDRHLDHALARRGGR